MGKAKAKRYPFEPDYAVPPGKTLEEYMEYHGLSRAHIAEQVGVSPRTISKFIKGEVRLSGTMARSLERAIGIPVGMWLNLESNYREQLAKLEKVNP